MFGSKQLPKCDRFGLHKSLRLQNRPHLEKEKLQVIPSLRLHNPKHNPPVLAKNMTALPSQVPKRLQNNSHVVKAYIIRLELERSLQNDIDDSEGKNLKIERKHDLLSNPWLPCPPSADTSRNRICLHRDHFLRRRFCPP